MLETLIRWAAYLGGWLLVAGPMIQARLELEAEATELSGIGEVVRSTAPPSHLSRWWWLVPPVAMFLTRRRQSAFLNTLGERLDTAQLAKLARFFAVARAWMIVACGAALIAIKETYELAHHHHWGATGFWLLVLIAAVGVATTNAATWKKPGRATRGL